MWVMTVAMLAVTPVVAPWSVETAPLLPDGLELTQVQPLSGQRVALLAHTEAAETWALLLMELGQTPELVQAFHDEPRFVHPSGSEVFVLAGTGPTNVYRLNARGGDLKRLGSFDFLIDDLACTADGAQCVLATSDSEVVAVGRVSRVVQTELRVSHVTINPSGTLITHDLPSSGCEVIRGLDPTVPQVTSVCESRSRRFASFEALQQRFEAGNEYGSCVFETTWVTDSVLELAALSMGEFECAAKPFRLDRRTLARSTVSVTSYPWAVLPCPHGGWQSNAGRIVTSCTEVIQLMMRGGRACGPECEPPPALPEAIALSAESVFIDVVKPASFSFERGRVKVPFELEGPSVVTMTTKGVVVQPIVWPGGVVTHSFDDGWHLLQTHSAPLTVHFVQAD